jgi:hypothetical protein
MLLPATDDIQTGKKTSNNNHTYYMWIVDRYRWPKGMRLMSKAYEWTIWARPKHSTARWLSCPCWLGPKRGSCLGYSLTTVHWPSTARLIAGLLKAHPSLSGRLDSWLSLPSFLYCSQSLSPPLPPTHTFVMVLQQLTLAGASVRQRGRSLPLRQPTWRWQSSSCLGELRHDGFGVPTGCPSIIGPCLGCRSSTCAGMVWADESPVVCQPNPHRGVPMMGPCRGGQGGPFGHLYGLHDLSTVSLSLEFVSSVYVIVCRMFGQCRSFWLTLLLYLSYISCVWFFLCCLDNKQFCHHLAYKKLFIIACELSFQLY